MARRGVTRLTVLGMKPAMSTEAPIVQNGTGTEWTQTGDRTWERTDGAVLRVKEQLQVVDVESFNTARHTESNRPIVALFHDEPLPSRPEEIYHGHDEGAALEAVTEFMEES